MSKDNQTEDLDTTSWPKVYMTVLGLFALFCALMYIFSKTTS